MSRCRALPVAVVAPYRKPALESADCRVPRVCRIVDSADPAAPLLREDDLLAAIRAGEKRAAYSDWHRDHVVHFLIHSLTALQAVSPIAPL